MARGRNQETPQSGVILMDVYAVASFALLAATTRLQAA
jgi:hypothetical protein